MIDSIFWHIAAVAGLGLLTTVMVLLAKILRKPSSLMVPGPATHLAKLGADDEATLAAFNAVLDRDQEYQDFDRPDSDLVEAGNMTEYIPQVRQFSEEVLFMASSIPEVHAEGVDPLLMAWDVKMVGWYNSVAEHQNDFAGLLSRAVEHDENQTVINWVVRSAIGFYSYDPLVKVREHIEAGKFFDEETTIIMQRQDWLLSQRGAYLAELDRLRSAYAARWDWATEVDEAA